MGGGRKALKAVCLCGCCIYNYINQIHISIIKDVPEHLGVNFVCWTWTKLYNVRAVSMVSKV